jgi:hypothetical protein
MHASKARLGLAALAIASLALLAQARAGEAISLAQAPAPVGGTYAVHGTNANGSTYTGTAVVKPDGGVYRFSWLIANGATFKGKGTLKGSTLVVDWGQKYPVIYEVGTDGVLHGTWDKGRAKETLVPQK